MSSILTLAGNNTSDASFYSHTIDQSLRFEDGDTAYISRTPSGAGNLKTWTWSAWVKRTAITRTGNQTLFSQWEYPGNYQHKIVIGPSDELTFMLYDGGANSHRGSKTPAMKFRDGSSWYHIVCVFDTSNSTAEDRMRIYVNGERITSFSSNAGAAGQSSSINPSLNRDGYVNRTQLHTIGSFYDPDYGAAFDLLDGYMAEVNFIDGTALTADNFGETKDGIWVPKDVSGLTYGTNGFHLDFADSSAIGNDVSGQNNDFAVSGLAATDVVLTSPTNTFATMNPLHKASGSVTLSEGNLKAAMNSTSGSGYTIAPATMSLPLSGKWYWEGDFSGANTGGSLTSFAGVFDSTIPVVGQTANFINSAGDYIIWYSHKNSIRNSSLGNTNNFQSHIDTQASGTVSFAIDMDNRWVWVAVNGVYINGTPDFSDGTNRVFLLTEGVTYIPFFAHNGGSGGGWEVNFGQDSSNVSSANSDSNGIGTFEYAVPSGYTSLCSANLPEPSIISGEDYFNTVLYAGNSGTQAITGVGFQPDWVWNKVRNHTYSHASYDSVRGTNQRLYQNHVYNEDTDSGLTSFDTDGFTLGSAAGANASGKNYVSWNWKAGGSAVSNSDGTITSSISANPEAGFSIVSWSGTSSAGTVGHGLGKTPSMYIVKNRTGDYFWAVYHSGLTNPATSYIDLDNNVAQSTSQTHWNSTAPTDSVFSVNNQLSVNNSSHTYIAYCFADIDGYCKAGSYTGANASDNTYVHLGFQPAWVMCKSYTQGGSGYDWVIYDNKRSPTNPVGFNLEANNNIDDESVRGVPIDFLSNGFKIRNSYGEVGSNKGYIYLAFAEQPAKYSNAR